MSDAVYLTNGRVNQKRRTREALLGAAVELLRSGDTVSVASAADLAGVSRTTAYRYFPSASLMATQASLWRFAERERQEVELLAGANVDLCTVVDMLVTQSDAFTEEHEGEFRAMLRVTLEQELGRDDRPRLRYFALDRILQQFAPSLGQGRRRRLLCALALSIGIEAQIVMRNVCQLTREESLTVKRWTAKVLVAAALRTEQGD